jgi:hypothetical protein
MADSKYVTVKCDVKSLFDSGLKSDLLKAMEEPIYKALDGKSGGKLTTKKKSDDAFVLTATLASLDADDKKKPTKLNAKVSISVLAVGSTAKAFTGSAGGSVDGFGSRVKPAATDLVGGVLEDMMQKVVKTMVSL